MMRKRRSRIKVRLRIKADGILALLAREASNEKKS